MPSRRSGRAKTRRKRGLEGEVLLKGFIDVARVELRVS
jgi:hypothetical protein